MLASAIPQSTLESTFSSSCKLLSTRRLPSPPCYRPLHLHTISRTSIRKQPLRCGALRNDSLIIAVLLGTGFGLTMIGPSYAAELPLLGSSIQLTEPSNALSLPTWAIHISSVVEWVTAMALVWQYGEKPGNESWKGLSWGMVPLLGGAFCACTWHFFYNSESLEVLVALQAALTVIGNVTMCIAAFRIYKSQDASETS